MRIPNPFHEGELDAQRHSGEAVIAQRNSVVIADEIIAGALPFLRQQKMVVLGSQSRDGSLWASLLFGEPGVVETPSARHLRFSLSKAHRAAEDVLWENANDNARVGMLAIELATRRRLRVNGRFAKVTAEELEIAVEEAYPNCPKYIQRRTLTWDETAAGQIPPRLRTGSGMSAEILGAIARADTCFVVSGHARGMDVSHRGGDSGFIRHKQDNVFRIPDYPGNSLFNTFGNLLLDPRTGVTVPDFETASILQMTGTATVLWGQEDTCGETAGTLRYWELAVDRWRRIAMPWNGRWQFLDASPFNPKPKEHA